MLYRAVVLVVCWVLAALAARAQGPMWYNLNSKIQVNSMAEEGPYLWLGTTSGLVRYDTANGTFLKLNVANSEIFGSGVKRVEIDANHQKLVTGLVGYATYNEFEGWQTNIDVSVSDIDANKLGHRWISTFDGLYYFDGLSWNLYTEIEGVNLTGNVSVEIEVDDVTNNAWIYTRSNKILKCSNGHWQAYNVSAQVINYSVPEYEYLVASSIEAHQGSVYLLNQTSTVVLGSPTLRIIDSTGVMVTTHCNLPNDPRDAFLGIQFDTNGDIKIPHGYVDTLSSAYVFGVYRYNGNVWSEDFKLTGVCPVPLNSLRFVCFVGADHNGNFYICAGYDNTLLAQNVPGLYKLSYNNVWSEVNYSTSQLQYNRSIGPYCTDERGNLYYSYGRWSSALAYKMDTNNVVTALNPVLCIDSVQCTAMAVDSNNNVWISTRSGSTWFENDALVNVTTCSIYPTTPNAIRELKYYKGKLYFLSIDTNGKYSVATFTNGGFQYGPYSQPYGLSQNGVLSNLQVTDSVIYALGVISSSPNTNALYIYRQGIWTQFNYYAAGLTSPRMLDIETDQYGKLWALNYNSNTRVASLIMYDGNSTTLVGTLDNVKTGSAKIGVTNDGVVAVYDGTNITLFSGHGRTQYPGIPGVYCPVADILPITGGKFWFVTPQDGILVFDSAGRAPVVSQGNVITGTVFYDYNFNGIRDSYMETGVPDQLVSCGSNVVTTNLFGNYSIRAGQGDNVVKVHPHTYVQAYATDSQHVVFATANGNRADSINFSCAPQTGIYDLSVTIVPTCLRPGRTVFYSIVYKNNGSSTMYGSVTFGWDSLIQPILSSPGVHYSGGDSVTYQFTGLAPGQQSSFVVTATVSTAALMHATATTRASIYPVGIDTFKADNYCLSVDTVKSSYDPNEKRVTPSGGIQPGQKLTYTVLFQNTGNDTAFRVVISDTLSDELDLTTLKILGASHSYTWSLSNRILTFKFDDIYLPDSNVNEMLSHGFVKYSIEAGRQLTYQTSIVNTAYIYFDYNAPVQTNSTINFRSIKVVHYNPQFYIPVLQTLVFPNPASIDITVQVNCANGCNYRFDIYNLNGQLVNSWQGAESISTYNCAMLAAGCYTYRISSPGMQVARGKLVIQ